MRALRLSAPVVLLMASSAWAATPIAVDATTPHQVWFGFGATHISEVFGTTDVLTASQRARALDVEYNQVKVRTGQIPILFEAPQSAGSSAFSAQANDNGDPFVIDWAGFNTVGGDTFKAKVVDGVAAAATADLYPSQNVSTRWGQTWLEAIRTGSYDLFLDEAAENVLAGVTRFNTVYGREPAYDMLFNEPTSGNQELTNGTDQVITDLVKRCGARLRSAGFNNVKFVVPGQETEDKSLSTATAILADPAARQYVGAIAYHPYPYGSTYSYIPNILSTSGAGVPAAGKVTVRNQLRDLGRLYGIPVWMTEVSNGFYGDSATLSNLTSFAGARGRAIHIHDEILYAEASAFFGMQSEWSTTASQLHGLPTAYGNEVDDIVYTDQATDTVFVTGLGRAIGHYARFINKGAVVLDSTSGNALVQVTAFRDTLTTRLVLVIINNDGAAQSLQVSVNGLALTGNVTGEQSTGSAFWQALPSVPVPSSGPLLYDVPALSITTLSIPFGGSSNAAPAVSAGVTQTITLPAAAALTGTASDDGLPNPPGALALAWTKVSGPGAVTFGSASSANTTASFTLPGTYVLRLTASDGALSATGGVTVNVQPQGSVGGPLAWWTFDEGSGTAAADSTGNGHGGTLVSPAAWTTGGRVAGALQLDGTSGYVAVPSFSPPSSITLEAWVRPLDNTGTDSIILNKHNSEYDFRISGVGYLSGSAGGTSLTDSAYSFYAAGNANVWHHVVYAFNRTAGTHALYRDGVQVASGANAATISATTNPLWIGRHSQFNFGTFKGALDEVKIHDRALSAADVLAAYNAVVSPPVSSSSSATSLAATSSSQGGATASGGSMTSSLAPPASSTGTSSALSSRSSNSAGGSTSDVVAGSSGRVRSSSGGAAVSGSGDATGTGDGGDGGNPPRKCGCEVATDGGPSAMGWLPMLGALVLVRRRPFGAVTRGRRAASRSGGG